MPVFSLFHIRRLHSDKEFDIKRYSKILKDVCFYKVTPKLLLKIVAHGWPTVAVEIESWEFKGAKGKIQNFPFGAILEDKKDFQIRFHASQELSTLIVSNNEW